ncbi:hypothetical protein AKO1_012798 [Acrasis kona]|uniref:Lyrm2 n=1 Tax=Acrasis kona TaxID=1008807 RepID=A0AAW2YW35_9EUKA
MSSQKLVVDVSREAVLGLYRKFIRNAANLPRSTQRSLAMQRARHEFRKPRSTHDELVLSVRIAHSHIDDLVAQTAAWNLTNEHDAKTEQMKKDEVERQRKKQEDMARRYREEESASWERYEDPIKPKI